MSLTDEQLAELLRWLSEFPTSVVFHERGIESVEAVHGHGGKTQIVWLSDELEPLSAMEQERDGLRDRIAEVLTWCDDASQVTGRVGYVSANAIREIFADSNVAPTNSQTWEHAERALIDAAMAVDHAWRFVDGTGARMAVPLANLSAAIDALGSVGLALPLAVEGCICSHTIHADAPGAPVELNADADCPVHGEKAYHA